MSCRLEQAKCLLDEAEALCVEASGQALEKANVCLQTVVSILQPGDDPTPLRGRVARVRRLIEEAGRVRFGWGRVRASSEAGYSACGTPVATASNSLEVHG